MPSAGYSLPMGVRSLPGQGTSCPNSPHAAAWAHMGCLTMHLAVCTLVVHGVQEGTIFTGYGQCSVGVLC